MSLSQRVVSYLDKQKVRYQTLFHDHSHSSLGSAIAAHVPSNKIAKAVLLEDEQGHRIMAVLPADSKVDLASINDILNRRFRLMKEQQLCHYFEDCENGAIPPLAQAYNLEAIVDHSLMDLPDIYFEGGDHRSLVHLSQRDFSRMMRHAVHASISKPVFH